MLIEEIQNLDDPAAVRLLRRVAKEKAVAGAVEAEVSPELAQAFAAEFGVESAEADATPGDLARATLLLLADGLLKAVAGKLAGLMGK